MNLETCFIEGRVFNRENPHLPVWLFYAMASQKALNAPGFNLSDTEDWVKYSTAAGLALKKAKEWEDKQRSNANGPR